MEINNNNMNTLNRYCFVVIALITVFLLPHTLIAQTIFNYNGITYKIIKDADESSTFGTVAVTAKSDDFYEGEITIPSAVKQSDDEYADVYKVVAIDDFAFKGSPTLTKVVLPMTIESIGNGAFEECSQLINIDIPNGALSQLGESVFASSRIKSIKLPEGITELPRFTFKECRALEQVILPESLLKVGISAFIYCESLKSIELPKRLREIDVCAFAYCGLESISLPNKVVVIPMSAFQGCPNLEQVQLSPYTSTIKTMAFSMCVKLQTINRPETITTVENGAFVGCSNIPDYYK